MDAHDFDFEKVVNRLKIDDKPKGDHRHKLRLEMLRTFEASKQTVKTDGFSGIRRAVMQSRITKFAAAAVLVGALIFIMNQPKALYARAMKEMRRARTLHIVVKEYRDREWFRDQDIWCDRRIGFVEKERYASGIVDVHIAGAEYEWQYRVGGKFVSKLKRYQDADKYEKLFGILQERSKRYPGGDKLIDGVACKQHVLTDVGESKVSVWVDREGRIRWMECEQEDDDGVERKIDISVQYEVPLGEEMFVPEFGPDAKVVNPSELLEEKFSLDEAVFVRESVGFVFAVHELKLGEDGLKYLVCSNRLSEETRRVVSSGNPWNYYGQLDLLGRFDSGGDFLETSDEPILLGRMRHDGVQVDWYVLVPMGSKAIDSGMCDVAVDIDTANELSKRQESLGLSVSEEFRLNTAVEESGARGMSLKDICGSVFSVGKNFGPIVHSFLLTEVVTRADGSGVRAWRKCDIEVTQAEFIRNIEGRVQKWSQRR